MRDITYLRPAILFVATSIVAVAKSSEDGKFDLGDLGNLFPVLKQAGPAFSNLPEALEDLKDLDDAEMMLIVADVRGVLGAMGISKAVMIANASIECLPPMVNLYRVIKGNGAEPRILTPTQQAAASARVSDEFDVPKAIAVPFAPTVPATQPVQENLMAGGPQVHTPPSEPETIETRMGKKIVVTSYSETDLPPHNSGPPDAPLSQIDKAVGLGGDITAA